jgi:mRNA-degrading endonuclease RelE of RelBE toxin-antitoxin system
VSWQIVFTARARKELRSVPSSDRIGIYRALEKLAGDHPNLDIKKLWAEPPQWRLRVGKWRLIYAKGEASNLKDPKGPPVPTLTVLNVFDRKEGY